MRGQHQSVCSQGAFRWRTLQETGQVSTCVQPTGGEATGAKQLTIKDSVESQFVVDVGVSLMRICGHID